MSDSLQGVIFALSGKALRDRRQTIGHWEVELREGAPHIALRSSSSNINTPISTVVSSAHQVAQLALDVAVVEDSAPLLIVEPNDNVVWRVGPHGLKVQSTNAIDLTVRVRAKAEVVGPDGQPVPDPPYMPPQHHFAFRYFRYSQSAQNILDSYRNMFLALESILDSIAPKQAAESETEWLQRALASAQQKGLDLGSFAKPGSLDSVRDFIETHYSVVRCAAFHAKNSISRTLRPGDLSDSERVLEQLLRLQALVEHLLKSECAARLPKGGFYPTGFAQLLSSIAPRTYLIASPGICPTAEGLMSDEAPLDDAAPYIGMPVTLRDMQTTSRYEWLLYSDIDPSKLPFTRISTFRLAAKPGGNFLVEGIVRKMNATTLETDLDLTGVKKLTMRARCLLHNVQGPRRRFAH